MGEINGANAFHGEGSYTCGEFQYSGGWVNDTMTGVGTLDLADGTRYTGGFSSNAYHGQGVLVYPSGEMYEGEWDTHVRHGVGTLSLPCGSWYAGQWVGGVMEGEGEASLIDGSRYSGLFLGGEFHGEGTLVGPDSAWVYVGAFEYGARTGYGVLTAGERVYSGEWAAGAPEGEGNLVFDDGRRYVGQWVKGRPHGAGKFVFPDGAYYEGMWERGVLLDQGAIFVDASGSIFQHSWQPDQTRAPHPPPPDTHLYPPSPSPAAPPPPSQPMYAHNTGKDNAWLSSSSAASASKSASSTAYLNMDVMDLEDASRGLPAPYTWYDPVIHSLSCKLLDKRAALAGILDQYDMSATRHGFLPLPRVRQALRNVGIRLSAEEYEFVLAMFGPDSEWINTDDLVRFVKTAEREWHRRHPCGEGPIPHNCYYYGAKGHHGFGGTTFVRRTHHHTAVGVPDDDNPPPQDLPPSDALFFFPLSDSPLPRNPSPRRLAGKIRPIPVPVESIIDPQDEGIGS